MEVTHLLQGERTMTTGEEGKYLMQFFHYEQLPAKLQAVNRPFCELARQIEATLPNNPEKTTALRKLLESKDCAVRALIFEQDAGT
jgi:hypothetical protein